VNHRHLNHTDFTLAAIDDILLRGKYADWVELLDAMDRDPLIREKILRVCESDRSPRPNQRYILWREYVKQRAAS
jgi:hypothetical protein